MSRRHRVVQGDTQALLTVDLSDRPSRGPIDVSGVAVVRMYLRADPSDGTVLDTVIATKLPGQLLDDGTLDHSIATLGQGGRVQFLLPQTFTGRPGGYYEGEIEVTLNTGTVITVYDIVKISIRADF
jgi:hypothetical protein